MPSVVRGLIYNHLIIFLIGTAEGDDFRLIGSRTLRFDEAVSEQTVSIEILEDTFYEGLEVFRLQLRTDDTGVQLMPQTVEISIIDNERKSLDE